MVRKKNYRVPQLTEVSLTTSSIDGTYRVSCERRYPDNGTDEATDLASLEADEEKEDSLLINSGVPGVKNSESYNSNSIAPR